MNKRAIFVWTGLFAAVLFVSGCGPKLPDGMPPLHSTVITIVQDGTPLEGALVTMVNADASGGWACAAKTDATGNAIIKTNGMYDGAPEGTYKVTVVKQISDRGEDPYAGAPDPAVDMTAYQEWFMKNEAKISEAERRQTVTYDLVDPQFGSLAQTTLEVTVTPGKNAETLDVGPPNRTEYKEVIVR